MENLNLVSRKKFTMDKFVTQLKVNAESEIKRVLNVSANSIVTTKDCANGMVCVGGKIKLDMLYVSMTGNIENAQTTFDFIEKQQCGFELSDLIVSDNIKAVDVNFSGAEAIVSAEHNVQVDGSFVYAIGENFDDESLVLNKKTFSCSRLFKTVEDTFVVADEASSNLMSVSVLSALGKASVVEVNASVDKVVVEGKALIGVTYQDAETTGYFQREVEFKQEVSAENVTPNMLAKAEVRVANVTVTPEEKEDKTNFVYAIDLSATVFVYEESSYDVVSDMFSLKNYLSTTTQFVEANAYSETKEASETVLSTTNVAEIENFDDIIGVFEPYYELTGVEDLGSSVMVYGEVSAYALYKADGEVFRLDIKKDVSTEIQKDSNKFFSDLQTVVQTGTFKVKAGKELEANFSVEFHVDFETKISENFVKSFELKEERPASKGGITVYVAGKGDTLFEVAKAVGVRPEEISKQNDVAEVFEQGEKIYIYSPINLI